MSRSNERIWAAAALALLLGACSSIPRPMPAPRAAEYPRPTLTGSQLANLPPPASPIAVAVYGLTDQTGQFKPSETQTLSRAVTQGGGAVLVAALQDAGGGRWFDVLEREQIKDVLTERQIIGEMRSKYLGEKSVDPAVLPPLLYAGVIVEGAIVAYDSNTRTGGEGLSLFGVSVSRKWQEDTVTLYLRAVSVKTGKVLCSVKASKTIASQALTENVFRYVAKDAILGNEAGLTHNEPVELALQQAVEKALYALVMEGVEQKLWSFADPAAGWPMLWRYRQEKSGALSPERVLEAEQQERRRGAAPVSSGRSLQPTVRP